MCHAMGGKVEPGVKKEFGRTEIQILSKPHGENGAIGKRARTSSGSLFEGLRSTEVVWMSHGDKVTELPKGFSVIADSANSEFAAVADASRRLYGVQFHPEVTHTPHGTKMISNFLKGVCGLKAEWNMKDFCKKEVERITNLVGDKWVIGAVSGGVDSSVAAALIQRAVKDKFRPFLVDTGLLRKDEAVVVKARLEKHIPGLQLKVLDAKERFYS